MRKIFRNKLAVGAVLFSISISTLFCGGCNGGLLGLKEDPIAESTPEPTKSPVDNRENELTGTPLPSVTEKDASKTYSDEEFLKKVNRLKKMIDIYYLNETDEQDMYEDMYRGLLNSLGDPYSCYYTPEEYAELMESMDGVYCGIGALVSQNASTKVITIVRPFVNGPAYNSGILPGDILVEIDGEDITTWDINLAVKRMKGEQNTEVLLKLWRPSAAEYITVKVIRDVIEVETVTYQMLPNSIGFIYIMEFDDITKDQFETAVNELTRQGMKGLVIDIRDNPGGLLDTVCEMLDLFVDDNLLVYTLDKYESRDEIHSNPGKVVDVPTAVLINQNSASASEIFSGTLQDYKLATIIGTQSFGKGIVQSVIPLSDGSAVKMTVSRYYTPADRCIHGIGITPDVVVELDDSLKTKVIVSMEEDNQLQAAISYIEDRISK